MIVGTLFLWSGKEEEPHLTVTLLSETGPIQNRVATLILSNAGPGSVTIGVFSTNTIDSWLTTYATTGKIDQGWSCMTFTPRDETLAPGDSFLFVEAIPEDAVKWQLNTIGKDPRKVHRILKSRPVVKALDFALRLPLPDAFWSFMRKQRSSETFVIHSPWFWDPDIPTEED